MPTQIPLPLNFPPTLESADFWVGECNQDAVLWLKEALKNRSGLFIYGPLACGKSHLLRLAAMDTGLSYYNGQVAEEMTGDMLLIDDIFPIIDEEKLFHLYNRVNGRMILTAHVPPSLWPIRLPDLRSRLLSLAVVGITLPDSRSLEAILLKLFADRRLKVSAQAISFIANRTERSFKALVDLVAQIDQLSWSEKREITLPLIKEVMAKCAE